MAFSQTVRILRANDAYGPGNGNCGHVFTRLPLPVLASCREQFPDRFFDQADHYPAAISTLISREVVREA